MKRPRVLLLIKGLGRGGAELLLCHAAELRDREAFDYEAGYLLASRSWLADELRAQDVPVHLFAASGDFDFGWMRRLRRFLLARRFDILHVHSPMVAGFARLVVRSLPRASRPKMISTEHVPWSGYSFPTRILNAVTFPLDDAHLAVSEAVLRSVPRPFRGNVKALIHGIPLDRVRSKRSSRDTTRAQLGIGPDEILVGTVANFRAQKAYPDLVAAASMVIAPGRAVRFAAVGRGPLESEIQELARRRGLGDRFMFLGPLDDAATFIAGCDLFALSSHYEGLPLAVMEALALGVPVVATNVAGVAELVNDGVDGILVPKARPDLFADALDTMILDSELRESMAKAAAEDAPRFDNRAAFARIEALYHSLLARPADDETLVGEKGVTSR